MSAFSARTTLRQPLRRGFRSLSRHLSIVLAAGGALLLCSSGAGAADDAAPKDLPIAQPRQEDQKKEVHVTPPDTPEIQALPGYRGELMSGFGFAGQAWVLQAGPEKAPPVVLLHGISQDGAHDWDRLIPVLAQSYRVLAVDLPGFGRSSKKTGEYDPPHYTDFVLDVIDNRIKGPFALIAHSMGVSIGLEVAARRPADVKRLILADAAAVLHGQALSLEQIEERAEGLSVLGDWVVAPVQRRAFDMLSTVSDRMVAKLAGSISSGNATVIAARLMAHDSGPAIDSVKAPVLLIWGEEDEVVSRRGLWALAARLPKARIAIIEGAKHVPMIDQPEAFNALAVAWLEGREDVGRPLAPLSASSDRQGNCHREKKRVFEGAYDTIKIKRCSGVILRGVRARHIDIHRSTVFAEDLGVEGGPIGIKMWRSRLRVSGGKVTGEVALELGGSEVDFAGVTLIGEKAAVVGTADVNFLCSLCRLESPAGRLRLHGLREFSVGDQL